MNVFWFSCGGNFGDEFTAWYLENRYDRICLRTPPEAAHFVGTGSTIQNIPPSFKGHIVGTGCMFDRPHRLPLAMVHSVRGPLTARLMDIDVPYGDIGLLASDYAPPTVGLHDLGVIPHYVDTSLASAYPHGRVINIQQNPRDFIKEVAHCKEIVTSSLHAIIAADSLGIPRKWVPHGDVLGDGFKFRDYAASIGTSIVPGTTQMAPREAVESTKSSIRSILDKVMT